MQLAARSGAWSGMGMPYDAEVEWLSADGHQYVLTEFHAANDCGLRVVAVPSVGMSTESHLAAGARFSSGTTRWFVNFGNDLQVSWADVVHAQDFAANVKYDIRMNYLNSRESVVDGVRVASISKALPTSSVYPAAIFSANQYGTFNSHFVGRISLCEFTRGSAVAAQYIPVRFTNEDGASEGAMYDRVSGQLFRNVGSGEFTIGPDKARFGLT